MATVLLSPAATNQGLTAKFEQAGIRRLTWPSLNLQPPSHDSSLRDAIENIFGYDWLILKNPRAAEYFMRAFGENHGQDELDRLRILAIGAETFGRASKFDIHVDILLERFAANTAHSALKSYVGDLESARLNLLIPNANVSRELFEDQFETEGARVDSVTAYKTCSHAEELVRLKAMLAGGAIDCVAFTGASAVDEFACLFDTDHLPRLLHEVRVLCDDEPTALAAHKFALSHSLISSATSAQQLVDLINTAGKSPDIA